MDPTAEANRQKVVKFVQELLLEEGTGRHNAGADLRTDRDGPPDEARVGRPGLDREAAIDQLIRRFSLWIGQRLHAAERRGPYCLAGCGAKARLALLAALPRMARTEAARSRPWTLSTGPRTPCSACWRIRARQDTWDRRGLVAGEVQSGKTANYTGFICKAADAGYKIVIVLAGLHNNLRSQTQMRLDEGFLGYETAPTPDDIRIIGVGEIDGDPKIRPNYATNRSNNGRLQYEAREQSRDQPRAAPLVVRRQEEQDRARTASALGAEPRREHARRRHREEDRHATSRSC